MNKVIDLTNYVCPLTYVMLKAHLEELEAGAALEADFQGQNTLADVTKTLKLDGYIVTKAEIRENAVYRLTITKR